MDRRSFLKFLIATAASEYVDYEKLLWVPGEKTIFIPPLRYRSELDIIATEMDRLTPQILRLFERDDFFYTTLKQAKVSISPRAMRLPLIIRPGGPWNGEEE